MNFLSKTTKRKEQINKGEDNFEDSSSNKQKDLINFEYTFLEWKMHALFFKENIAYSLYKDIFEDYLSELKKNIKGNIKILINSHHIDKT